MSYLLHLLIYFAIFGLAATSLNVVAGYCGLLSLAHAGYFAIGAYVYAIATACHGWGVIPSLILAMGCSSLASLLVSLSSWRLRGDFFVLISLAIQAVIFGGIYNWFDSEASVGSWSNLTNGAFGIGGVPRPTLFGWVAQDTAAMAALTLGLAAAGVALSIRLLAAPWGRMLKACRDDELAARSLGKNVRRARVNAVAFACALVGLAGALYAAYVGYVDPSTASLDQSILLLSMIVIGGMGNWQGPLIGAALLVGLPELLAMVHLPDAVAANVRMLIFGCSLTVLMHVRPQGVAGDYRLE